jgi:hypothetical protein
MGTALAFIQSLTIESATGTTTVLPPAEPGDSAGFLNALILHDPTRDAK